MARKKGRRSKGASLSDLKTGTHRGRAMKLPKSDGKPFVSANGLAKMTAPAMLHNMSPTPHGPESRWPNG